MNLSIVQAGGSSITVSDISPEAPLSSLKERVAGPSGVLVGQQVFTIDNVTLSSMGDPSLESFGIKDGTTLTLIQSQCPLVGVWKGSGYEGSTAMSFVLDGGDTTWIAADLNLLAFKIKWVSTGSGNSITEVYEGKYNAEPSASAELGKIEAFGQRLELVDATATPEELARVEELKSMPRSGLSACIHRLFDNDQDGRLNPAELANALAPYHLEARGVTVQHLCQNYGWDEIAGPNIEELTTAFESEGPLAAFKDEALRGYITQVESVEKPAYRQGFIITTQLELWISGDTVSVVWGKSGTNQIDLHKV